MLGRTADMCRDLKVLSQGEGAEKDRKELKTERRKREDKKEREESA